MLSLIASLLDIFAEQNQKERSLTVLGLALFIGFIFYLVLDSTIKQKLVPKNKVIRRFLIAILIMASIGIGLYIIFVK